MKKSALAFLAVNACVQAIPAVTRPLPKPPTPSPLLGAATAGVHDAALRALLAEHWEWSMRWWPTWATSLGDHRYDDKLALTNADAIALYEKELREHLAKAEALDTRGLDERDRVSFALFLGGLAAEVQAEACHDEQWEVSARHNPFEALSYELGEGQSVKTPADGKNLLARLSQAPRVFDDSADNLRMGLSKGLVAPRESVRRTVAQLDGELAKNPAEWAFALPAKEAHADWSEAERTYFASEVLRIVREHIRPAVLRYRNALRDEVLPHGRTGEREGLGGLGVGEVCYRAKIRMHLDMERDPRELHELGLREVEQSDAQLAALGKKLFGTTDLASTVQHLREDKSLYFASREQILEAATLALSRAQSALPNWFGHLPKTPCVVREMPAYEAPYSTTAYYRQPHYDGTKPGEYFVNTYEPQTRPAYDFATLSYHESVPGHHVQIAIAQELGELPLFRKLDGSTAFVEGWALYSERLADEMGLYASDLDRLGMWSFDAWRGARLVVDTGLHAFGWTREQAESFLLAHTALTPDNVSNEVDRYISTPGQALAYKVGQLEILGLREYAKNALGERFDIRAFHDVVLGAGAVTMPVLHERVHAFTKAQGGRALPCSCGYGR
jgi:uncharacterized protein (DUF885 family)